MILLKLDISKAFDTLSWLFLLELVQARGFGEPWRRWVAALLSMASSRILLNGQQGPPIKHLRGVRQGDSLSPMLFIIAMDVLHRMLAKASRDGMLRPMQLQEIKFQCSLYADDVTLFIRTSVQEARAVKEILRVFGEASGLTTNLAKCSITPIFGGEAVLLEIVAILGCQVQEFPIRYLGLQLSTKKLPKAHVHSIVEAVARKVLPCHGSLMARSGRLVWIKSVLRVVPIYSMMADCLPPWAIKEIDMICKKFLWVGGEALDRGRCLVAWHTACKPTELGGLGISDLKLVGYALQARWLWLQKADSSPAWSQLPLDVAPEVQAFFRASTYTELEDGMTTLFWDDRWLQQAAPADLAPNLVQLVPRRIRSRLTVQQGIANAQWTGGISRSMSLAAIAEYLEL